MYLVTMTLVLVVSETIGHIGEIYPEKFLVYMKFGYYIIYALDPVDYLLAILYINCWLDDNTIVFKKATLVMYKSFMVINFLLITVSVLLDLKWFYYFDGYDYIRGPYFFVRGVIILIFCALLSVYTIMNRKSIYQDYRKPIFALPTLALVGALMQIFFTDLNTTYASISIGLLVLFFYLQAKNLDVDYLTGALNRRGLDIKMDEYVKSALSNGQRFSAIMMDLDFFKEINDTYGHQEGDNALKAISSILYKVFSNKASIGRFGGDEFCVLAEISTRDELEEKLEMLDDEIELWNYKNDKNYKLQLSMGDMIYDPAKGMSTKEFQKAIDELMYIDKREHHLEGDRR